ncbi:MAG: hypothetical protein HW421_3896 [Ignavibacteria bacterium]|nr:hypothetical protein [Ignavibacteria bacterium]
MKTKEEEKYNQSRRILNIFRLFLTNRKMTVKEVINEINERFPDYSVRSIQRDMKILADEGYIELSKKGRVSIWSLCLSNDMVQMPFKLKESELLSFYILKAYLKTFAGTTIEKDINHLGELLETYAPGTVIMDEQFYGNQDLGDYNYSGKHEIIRQCINHIIEKNWITIMYERMSDGKIKSYSIFPNFLYSYLGGIYLLAYHPKYKKNTNFAIQNIISIEEYFGKQYKIPDFNYPEFRKQRFAVFDGAIKTIKLKVRKEFVKYFENRSWHPTQRIKNEPDGTLIITMDVPLSNEFISWICYWNDALIVMEPKELIDSVKKLLITKLKNYSE